MKLWCVPPVIPGGTEKMGHFFSSDPESTGTEVRKCLSFSDMMGRWDTPEIVVCPTCHSGRN
ncbi:hypothetical protein QUF72_09020 [Desulfobacterales bacterium HSG2]|nr:hypothetical protein [Desulfobacterales bacterium HSG2]